MRDFKQLIIWRSGLDITKKVYRITKKLPEDEKFGLCSQMRRSAVFQFHPTLLKVAVETVI